MLGTGKALIIAHKGVDCSICQNSASSLQSWASQNTTKVEVWGAMTWKNNASTFNPPCNATHNWVSQYNWNDIFAFADQNRAWIASGTPRYYVYSPRDSTIVWQGSSQSVATNRALQESTVGLSQKRRPDPIKVYGFDRQIKLENLPTNVNSLRVIDLKGRVIKEVQNINRADLIMGGFKQGLFIVELE